MTLCLWVCLCLCVCVWVRGRASCLYLPNSCSLSRPPRPGSPGGRRTSGLSTAAPTYWHQGASRSARIRIPPTLDLVYGSTHLSTSKFYPDLCVNQFKKKKHKKLEKLLTNYHKNELHVYSLCVCVLKRHIPFLSSHPSKQCLTPSQRNHRGISHCSLYLGALGSTQVPSPQRKHVSPSRGASTRWS